MYTCLECAFPVGKLQIYLKEFCKTGRRASLETQNGSHVSRPLCLGLPVCHIVQVQVLNPWLRAVSGRGALEPWALEFFFTHRYTYMYIHTYIYIHIYIYIQMQLCPAFEAVNRRYISIHTSKTIPGSLGLSFAKGRGAGYHGAKSIPPSCTNGCRLTDHPTSQPAKQPTTQPAESLQNDGTPLVSSSRETNKNRLREPLFKTQPTCQPADQSHK